MLPAVLSVGAIAAVVLLLIGIYGRTPESSSALPSTPTATTASTTSAAPTTAAATSSPLPASTASAPTVSAIPTIPPVPVIVLNSTDTSGLAARVTEHLTALGWVTVEPDNFFPVLEVTTVYYPEGEEAGARLLAAAVPGDEDVVEPAIPEVAADVFTVVLGNDAEDWEAPPATSTTAPTSAAP